MESRKETSSGFGALVDSVSRLELDEKRRLWRLLDEEIAQAEEQLWEKDPTIRAEVREAKAAYENGDYVTLDEYLARQS